MSECFANACLTAIQALVEICLFHFIWVRNKIVQSTIKIKTTTKTQLRTQLENC